MSLFLTRPHPSRPRWQKILIILRNGMGWIVPAVQQMLDGYMAARTRTAIALLVITTFVAETYLWIACYVMDWSGSSITLVVLASVLVYLALGATYHGTLLEMGGRYSTERQRGFDVKINDDLATRIAEHERQLEALKRVNPAAYERVIAQRQRIQDALRKMRNKSLH